MLLVTQQRAALTSYDNWALGSIDYKKNVSFLSYIFEIIDRLHDAVVDSQCSKRNLHSGIPQALLWEHRDAAKERTLAFAFMGNQYIIYARTLKDTKKPWNKNCFQLDSVNLCNPQSCWTNSCIFVLNESVASLKPDIANKRWECLKLPILVSSLASNRTRYFLKKEKNVEHGYLP